MFSNATVSSRSSSSRSANSCSRNSSMPSLRMRNPLSPKTSYNPLFRHSDALTSFDASHFVFQEQKIEKIRRKDKHPILRRYNSHDSHTNFDIRIEESKDSTPESTKSRITSLSGSDKSSNDRKRNREYETRDFLERYSLPRVVRVGDSEPLLLYRCFDSFTKIQARGVLGKKGKEKIDDITLHFPEGFSGWFSLTNDKGERSAICHTSILHLVREQVCSFVSMQPFTAYAAHTSETQDGKIQYVKTQVRGGQLFQLRAVFQHKDRPDEMGGRNSTRSSRISRNIRDKDLNNRYAQLVSQNNQELYVQLTTKGEFYEIHSSMKAKLCFPGMLDKTGPLALDKDCLYKITHLLRRVALPLRVKLVLGTLPPGLPKDYTETFILERKFQEPLMVTCTLPPPTADARHHISCININSNLKISKCALGFDSENRLFKSQRLQAALAFCHKNVENWYREVRLEANLKPQEDANLKDECSECVKVDSLCLEHEVKPAMEEIYSDKQIITKEALEKFPKPKKWYKHFKFLGGSDTQVKYPDLKDPMEGIEKGKSIERYKDMSKLIEEKFGKKSYNPVKKSASFMFSTKRIDLEEMPQKNNAALLKCQSLDTQLSTTGAYSHHNRRNSKSNESDSLSYDFQMCILDNDNSLVENRKHNRIRSENDLRHRSFKITEINLDEIKPVENKMKKNKPDLIPTLPKDDDNSFITERLCSEFHVKTKIQKKPLRHSGRFQQTPLTIFNEDHKKSVTVQIHEAKPPNKKTVKSQFNLEDVPYSHVADQVSDLPSGTKDENIYAEICETRPCQCDSKLCTCSKRTNSEYCYVKLGSNGDSVTQSDSDEAIYNTLR
ncbi:unnamed protein product [Brassicogethes aeneus]|uniref:CABIT domain-containing protein n=1 Tax=Brassicogethes aeneus TaxID=1431903 RepID=A0A9P0AZJ3_BRAAE|nr:unnamed protein product [Brassicogethes aeneus]